MKYNRLILLTLVLTLLSPYAHAYIGPGAAVAFLGYIFGPIAAILCAVGLVLVWPARILYKKMKNNKAATEIDGDGSAGHE